MTRRRADAWRDQLHGCAARQLTRPTPAGLRWLDRLEDRCPVWALPWVLLGLLSVVAAVGLGGAWLVLGRFR